MITWFFTYLADNFDFMRKVTSRWLLSPPTGTGFGLVNKFRQACWKLFYELAASESKEGTGKGWSFINYGYQPADGKLIQLDKDDEGERCGVQCIQLYHEVVSAVAVEGKNVVEVGSGRGGGASYVARYLKPATYTAVELSPSAVELANRNCERIKNLHFIQGDALNLPLPDNSFDVVVNVESSHCYSSMSRFLSEAMRVLRPGGYMVCADMRVAEDVAVWDGDIERAGFLVVEREDITQAVFRSMKICNQTRRELMKDQFSPFLYRIFERPMAAFSGLEGSFQYKAFEVGDMSYMRYVLQKPE
jgi:ubiquinone/menaquinone biosynthesis C-methylase UbiE